MLQLSELSKNCDDSSIFNISTRPPRTNASAELVGARERNEFSLAGFSYFFFFAPVAAFFSDLDSGSAGVFWSPRTVVSGQTLKAGHFSQPATIAIGQMTMADSLSILDRRPSYTALHFTRVPLAGKVIANPEILTTQTRLASAMQGRKAGTRFHPARESFAPDEVAPVGR